MHTYIEKCQPSRFATAARRILFLCGIAPFLACGQTTQTPPKDLTSTSLEDLMNVEVTTASRKEQRFSEVPAALFVITPEDIRRSGAQNLPDVLRMVPGLDVAQINASNWAISARGFNLEFANKLLVMVDGRAVYTPLFGGVNWDTLNVPLEDIERIEVILGPGGTIWGANAVNGVINILTKKAEDTQGLLISGGGGTVTQSFGVLRYGGKIKDDTDYRVFATYEDTDHLLDAEGQDAGDGWYLLHGGYREETRISAKDALTTQGDLYTGTSGNAIVHSELNPPQNVVVLRRDNLSGGDFVARWKHTSSERFDTSVQFYFDQYTRDGPESYVRLNTVDIDVQSHLALGSRQDLIFGGGYRHASDTTIGTIDQAFVPADFQKSLVNLFVQDEITLKPERVALYAGTKLENNYFSGYDLQPSLRLAWTPSGKQTLWAAISRSSRTPTQRDIGLLAALAAFPGPELAQLQGNPNFGSEHVISYEVGYRTQPSKRLSFALDTFINDYTSLESIEALPPYVDDSFNPPVTILPSQLGNRMHGMTEGLETYANWKVTSRWTLSPGYSFLEMHLHTDADSTDTISVADTQGSSPSHQAQLRSHVALVKGLTWDVNTYFVGRLPAQGIASYTRMDAQLMWRFWERGTFSVVGQNLLRDHHFEFNDFLQEVNSSQIKRGVYAKLTLEF